MAGFVEHWWEEADKHDLFVHVSEEEGFCIVVAEAMMVGLPVVATPVGGLEDYSAHEETAVHVPVGDPEALADAIARLIADEPRRRRIGTAASANINRIYAPPAIRAHYRAINSRLLFGSGDFEPFASSREDSPT